MTRRHERVVVAGSGHALWLAAAVLRGALGEAGVQVIAVETPAAAPQPEALAALPPLHGLHRRIGLDPDRVMAACSGTGSLGVQAAGFSGPQSSFVLPYGGHGPDVAGAAFASVYARARRGGLPVAFEDFSLNAAAANQGRFFVADRATAAYALCDSGAHLHAAAYARLLKARALALGVEAVVALEAAAERDGNGDIAALRLDDGRCLAADLFVDVDGGLDPGAPFQSWRDEFSFDRLLLASAPPFARLPGFGRMQATPHGVVSLRPLQGGAAVLFAFASAHLRDEDAAGEAEAATGLRLREDRAIVPLAPGRREAAWTGNLVRLGAAACRFDPMGGFDLHALQLGLSLLVTLLPSGGIAPVCATAFNRRMAASIERLRDVQAAHLKLNAVPDAPPWTDLRAAPVSEALAQKIELFAAIGEVALRDDETFLHDSWAALFLGLGLVPERWSPLADALPDERLIAELQGRLRFVRERVQAMSSHDAHVETHWAGPRA